MTTDRNAIPARRPVGRAQPTPAPRLTTEEVFPEAAPQQIQPQTPASTSGKAVEFTIAFVLKGYPVAARFTGTAAQLDATIARLQGLGAVPPPQPPQQWSSTPDGLPICPKHGTPMRKRERQGDTWYSHNMGADGEDCYCRGYPGKDSPGYEC